MVNWRRVVEFKDDNLEVKFGIIIDKSYTKKFIAYTGDIAKELVKQYPSLSKEEIYCKLIDIHDKLKEKYQSKYYETFIYNVEKDRKVIREITKEFMKLIKEFVNWIETENTNRGLETWIYTVADLDVKNNKVIPIVKPVKSTEG